jgi:hypothetical protein
MTMGQVIHVFVDPAGMLPVDHSVAFEKVDALTYHYENTQRGRA